VVEIHWVARVLLNGASSECGPIRLARKKQRRGIYREFKLVNEVASHAGTCDQLDVPLALALHELHFVARF
jgi:hypothetical protein